VRGGFDAPLYLGCAPPSLLVDSAAWRRLRIGDVLHISNELATHPIRRVRRTPGADPELGLGVLYGRMGHPIFFTDATSRCSSPRSMRCISTARAPGVRFDRPGRNGRPRRRRSGATSFQHPRQCYAVGAIDFTRDMPIILVRRASLGGCVPAALGTRGIVEAWTASARRQIRFRAVTSAEAAA